MKKSPWIRDTRPKLVYLKTWSINHIIFRTTWKRKKKQWKSLTKTQHEQRNSSNRHKVLQPLWYFSHYNLLCSSSDSFYCHEDKLSRSAVYDHHFWVAWLQYSAILKYRRLKPLEPCSREESGRIKTVTASEIWWRTSEAVTAAPSYWQPTAASATEEVIAGSDRKMSANTVHQQLIHMGVYSSRPLGCPCWPLPTHKTST